MSNTTIPAPISWAPSTYWDGSDGLWNSFIVQVGTPPQEFRVFPSTAGQETWVPVPLGCTSVDPSNPGYCGFLRGTLPYDGVNSSGFESNRSSTWQEIGIFDLDANEAKLGYGGNGDYGFDRVVWGNESTSPNLTMQVVAGFAAPDYWLGVVGIGPKPSNFTNYNEPITSFLSTLVNESAIASLSWGYTAGAAYRNRSAASLTLGGYDANRFEAPGLSITMNADDSRPLQVGIQKILATNTLNNNVNVLPTATYHFIDSTLPHIWLPDDACDAFVSAFGLTYDNKTDLFLINDTMRQKILNLSPTITFVLAENTEINSGTTQNIVLPYSAFDLQASYPYYTNATNYFPIRRAANDTQYTIGRTFLQEAYVIADFDRGNFTIAQTRFDSTNSQHLIAIQKPAGTSSSTTTIPVSQPSSSSGISAGAIAGIVVGAVLGLALLALAIVFVVRRKKQKRRKIAEAEAAAAAEAEKKPLYAEEKRLPIPFGSELPSESQINEVPGTAHQLHESDSRALAAEIEGDTAKWGKHGAQELSEDQMVSEVPGSEARFELYGSDIPKR